MAENFESIVPSWSLLTVSSDDGFDGDINDDDKADDDDDDESAGTITIGFFDEVIIDDDNELSEEGVLLST